MSNIIDKPRGYFEHVLAIDCETTGLNFGKDDVSDGHQALSWGIIVSDSATLSVVEELYVEIKWNPETTQKRLMDPTFGKKAEAIHGLTYDYLEDNGITEEEAVLAIGSLILKYWGPTNNICTLGHNVHLFDVPFLRDMFRRHGIHLKFGNRHIDSNSVGFAAFETYTSDQLFSKMGFNVRGAHNALEDAKMALESVRTTRLLAQSALSGTL